MASTLLERTRESHEEIERLERAICADFRNEAVTHKERLAQNHRVRSMLDDMANKSKRLVRTPPRRIAETEPRSRRRDVARALLARLARRSLTHRDEPNRSDRSFGADPGTCAPYHLAR